MGWPHMSGKRLGSSFMNRIRGPSAEAGQARSSASRCHDGSYTVMGDSDTECGDIDVSGVAISIGRGGLENRGHYDGMMCMVRSRSRVQGKGFDALARCYRPTRKGNSQHHYYMTT